MGYQDFITESEASALAGVSTSTLLRFAEAGYIEVESDSDGLTLYCKSQISEVFGLKSPVKRKKAVRFQPPSLQNTTDSIDTDEEPKSISARIEKIVSSNNESKEPSTTSVTNLETEKSTALDTSNSHDVSVASPDQDESVDESSAVAIDSTTTETRTATEHKNETSDTTSSELRFTTDHSLEIMRLQNLIQLLEKLLEAKSDELVSVKTERDWLRTRIERMEEKADRDQLLLMSETQMLRKLLEEKAAKRSLLRSALEWVGLTDPSKELSKRTAIDLRDVSHK